jgi:SAM-dependent methyltransferase
MGEMTAARYDGIADWYDSATADSAEANGQILSDALGPGRGLCLDLGCGTGHSFAAIKGAGRTPVGVELSADQLRLAHHRGTRLVRADAAALPFRDGAFDAVVANWISTDVDDFAAVMREADRVLRRGGRFVFFGVHPCFNGPCVERRDDGAQIVHPTYREARRHTDSPWWGADGIRSRVGGMRHLPLAELLNCVLDAGLQLVRAVEPGDRAIPVALVLIARKP